MKVDAYLRRIGAERPGPTDIGNLRRLQRHHLESVPFENLGAHLDEQIDLGSPALFDKIVQRRRGGLCYELNGAFAMLLRELGYTVQLLGARVRGRDGRLGPPLDHLALRVDLDVPWLVDVGFGRFSISPLRLDVREPQDDPDGRFLLREAPRGDLDVTRDGVVVYRLETRPRELGEFDAKAWWHSTSPRSPFTRGPLCSRLTPGGRITLAGRRLIEISDAGRSERDLTGDAAVVAAYRRYFGFEIDRPPEPRPRNPREKEIHLNDRLPYSG
ncbi:arylamine N-acetyltransferase family protein [Amycolatopsis thermophila]|uniref:N-hydroxyarylamine O-acetyltransferase n=1 Tax=Amycolatopsis thermophila TaxID=206084 RepID=A0ABU0F222_9PSEU|nr:arylamine N-acetyltransferase [Amycolatopsis thermophila]MDQ0381566.1 N-hydroxyarylamine O-acetyltransferase [Amycolatopsis thermophila]